MRKRNAEERFWEKVDKTDHCWNWTAYTDKVGYGRFWDGRQAVKAYRFAYEATVGPVPDRLEVDHACHNKRCVRPEHLRLTTRKQNQENLSGPQRNSKSGVRGVHWHKHERRWTGTIGHNYKRITVGYFDTIEEAQAAVIAERNRLFTHNALDR